MEIDRKPQPCFSKLGDALPVKDITASSDIIYLNQRQPKNQKIILDALQSGKLTTSVLMMFVETPIEAISNAATQALTNKIKAKEIQGTALDNLIRFFTIIHQKYSLSKNNKTNIKEILSTTIQTNTLDTKIAASLKQLLELNSRD